MEVKQAEMTREIRAEWDAMKEAQECSVCGGHLAIHTVAERQALAITCAVNHEHVGFRQRTCMTEELRRGGAVYPTIRDNIEAKMMVKTELNRALNLLQMRFPDSIKDLAGAALFINDCMRLGLDPLIQPAEAVPIAFKTKDKAGKSKETVAMITTEDGYLSMAARGCPDEYDAAPATMPLLDYLMSKHPLRPLVELQEMAKRTALEICDDAEAFVWVALGKRRSATDIYPVYGYYRQAEWTKAKNSGLPAGTQPGNQARVRAVKRWVRETFPECRQKMLEYTAEVLRRSEGATEARRFIDAEYRVIIDTTDKKTPLISPPGGKKTADPPKLATKHRGKQAENKVAESAKRSPDTGDGQGGELAQAAPSGADEDTLFSTAEGSETEKPREAAAAGLGFYIPLEWLNTTFARLHWTEGTALTWISSNLKIDTAGKKLLDVIPLLSREQADRFTRELQNRADGKPTLL